MSKLRNKSHLSSAPGCDFDLLVEISRAVVEIYSECSQMKFLSVRSRRLVECFVFCDFYFASSCEGPAERNSENFCERQQCPVSTCIEDASFPSDDCMTVFCKERKRKLSTGQHSSTQIVDCMIARKIKN